MKKNLIIDIDNNDNFVDGATVSKVGNITYDMCKNIVDEIYGVTNGRLSSEMIRLYQEDGIIAEPAGALSLSVLDQIPNIKGKNVICILSGGNNDLLRYPDILNRALVHQNKIHYYIIRFAQVSGQLHDFIKNILGQFDDIVRFEYIKKTEINFGNVLLVLKFKIKKTFVHSSLN